MEYEHYIPLDAVPYYSQGRNSLMKDLPGNDGQPLQPLAQLRSIGIIIDGSSPSYSHHISCANSSDMKKKKATATSPPLVL